MTIDTDKQPKIPIGFTIESHKKMGKLKLNPEDIELYLDNGQKDGKYIEGNELRRKIEDKHVLNACVLDYLFEHQDLIPESWKGKSVYFWGTIFRNADGYLYVECLCWIGGGWNWRRHWLDHGWYDNEPAASLSSIPRNSKIKTLGSVLGAFDPSDFESRLSRMEKAVEKLEKWHNKVIS
jgi:hypothetical protein